MNHEFDICLSYSHLFLSKKILQGQSTIYPIFLPWSQEKTELQKIKNQTEAYISFNKTEMLSVAQDLAFGTILGDTDMINNDIVRGEEIQ